MPTRSASVTARWGSRDRTTWSTLRWTRSPPSSGSSARPARIFWGIVRGGSPAFARMRLYSSTVVGVRIRPLRRRRRYLFDDRGVKVGFGFPRFRIRAFGGGKAPKSKTCTGKGKTATLEVMFKEALKGVVDGTDGGLAGLLMDFEGIPLEVYTKEGTPFDIEAVGAEVSVVVKAIQRATEM